MTAAQRQYHLQVLQCEAPVDGLVESLLDLGNTTEVQPAIAGRQRVKLQPAIELRRIVRGPQHLSRGQAEYAQAQGPIRTDETAFEQAAPGDIVRLRRRTGQQPRIRGEHDS